MRVKLLILVNIVATLTLSAQKITLDLNKSVQMASDSSLQAFIDKNIYLSSYWQFRSFKAGRLPSVSFSTTPLQYNRDFVKRYDSDQDIDVYRQQQTLFSSGNLSISQNFDLTGGTFYIDSELGYMRNFGDNKYTQFTSVPIRIGYYQSLFGFNGFKWEKKIEPLKYEKAERQFLYDREEISETTISYFFNLAMAQLEYAMAMEALNSSDTLYRIGQKRQEIASISQADLLTLKLDAVNAKNSLSNAELSVKRAMFSFSSYLDIPGSHLELILPSRPELIIISPDLALEYAQQNNPNYYGYKQELMEAEREVDRTKKSSNFSASFSASVGFNQAADNFGGAYKNPLQQDMIRIGLTIPILDWGVRKGQANMAKNNLNVTKLSIQQKKESLEQDIVMTVNDFNIQQRQIESAEEALKLADMAYNTTKERFIIGKADLNSLTLSLNRQNSAQRNYINSLRNYWLSYYKLRRLTLYDFLNDKPLSLDFGELRKTMY